MTPEQQLAFAQFQRKIFEAKLAQDKVTRTIIDALPENEYDHKALLARFIANPNGLINWLAERGVYRARVAYWNGHGYDYTSEPMNGIAVPRLQHGYGGHPQAWVRVI